MSYSINSEPEPYNSFPLGKIEKLEKKLNDLQNKFIESVKLNGNCMKSFIDENSLYHDTINKRLDNLEKLNQSEIMTNIDNVTSITITKLRQFSGIIGLEYYTDDGYDGGMLNEPPYNQIQKLWTYEDVKELVYKWVRQRMIDKKTNLCVLLSNVETLIYCYEGNVVEEPSIRVYGEIVRPNADIPDEEIKQTLIQFFTYLKEELKQYSVRFNFQGYNTKIGRAHV